MDTSIFGYEDFVQELSTLILTYPPPFVYIYDPIALRTTISVINKIITDTSGDDEIPSNLDISFANIDAATCFSQRLLFDTILGSLLDLGSDEDVTERWNDSWDSFIHGLRYLHSKKRENSTRDVRFVISIEQAHRLKEKVSESIIPLSRLNELSQIDITIIFISQTQWQDMKPILGASPEPYYIDVKPLIKSDIIKTLSSRFVFISQQALTSSSKYALCYDPSLNQLYTHYITMICDVCFPFIHDIDELAYIAAARWPGFVKPILSSSPPDSDTVFPSEDTRLRLIRLFNPTVTSALESLHPRLTNAADWAAANEPETNILEQSFGQIHSPVTKPGGAGAGTTQQPDAGLSSLPRMTKFILVASYIASTNPPKSDLRMFGRGLDEKKRRRRVMKTQSKAKGPSKVPQHLLGPNPFPIDRMIAILGALLEENDVDSRPPAPEFTIPGEYTDMEVSRVAISSAVMELASMHLLLRTSPPDRIDGPPSFKSAISQDTALALAKQLDIPLNDLLWETP
ncbi:hypothetical protein P691DRAFT_774394 [Macrolepiota fuliginosa MF-IS2]|uniref:Origin recognition complex subunit 5 n=1 Tax=Macrolepiota fuliginosa MF-IS2 TaxID=1400762 RepID=A0A9P6C3A4_9AGAR|nr:hypothetical protein P691DRAFT_774394 [Macrolepiota fuliginosa MF-IS2]